MTLKGMNLKTLDVQDMYTINGGGVFDVTPWLKKLTPAAVAIYIIENWADIKKGLSDGWNVR